MSTERVPGEAASDRDETVGAAQARGDDAVAAEGADVLGHAVLEHAVLGNAVLGHAASEHALLARDLVHGRHAVLVFDGVCVLCSGWVRFLLRHDHAGRYAFAAMQGDRGRALLHAHGLDPDDPLSLLLVEYDRSDGVRVSIDSDAVRRVLAGMGGLWRLAHLIAILPGSLRDPLYRLLARNRYRWFGRHEACMVPDPAQADRFL